MEPQPVALTTELPGRTSAYLVAEVRPQVGGILLKRLFTEGADVKAGEILYEIDPSSYQAAQANAKAACATAQAAHASAKAGYAQAQANRANMAAAYTRAQATHASAGAAYSRAQAALAGAQAAEARAVANAVPLRLKVDRFQELLAIHAVSTQDADDASAAAQRAEAEIQSAEAEIQGAEAALEAAQINLAHTRITAPIAGRIGRSAVTTGALVTANQATPLATIQQLDPVYVDVTQSTASLLRLRQRLARGELKADGPNQARVKLLLEDETPYPLEGTLEFSDVTVDPGTGSVTLRTVFPNPQHLLLPGMYVRAVLEEGVNDQAILVPQRGVTRNPAGQATVLVVGAEEKVETRVIEADRAVGDQWLVSKGLQAGDRVILEGLQRARPGTLVKAVPFGSEPAPTPAAAPGPVPAKT
ncbi:MAG: efflux RND transporter periplasmic adaptor subunit [Proteobacteria bacterium]|nr:efflux RND transporter periplasmic adaptor subunit [Pseudomonadota bacterium]